jgi:hypothetical protein
MSTTFILSRITRISRRSFSSAATAAPAAAAATTAAAATAVEPTLSIPTRHSRHDPPAACLSPAQLKEVTEEILASTPGTLIPYEPSKRDDSLHAWEVADESIQKVEWLIRGYSAQVKNTKMQRMYSNASDEDPVQCIDSIHHLVKRMEKEGSMYMELRHKMRSQLALEEQQDADDSYTSQREIQVLRDATSTQTIPQVFASPGQTIGMFDTLLDTMPFATNTGTPKIVGTLLKAINERFDQDGGLDFNVNPNTVPTQMTFNAGLRAIANTQSGPESTRDDALLYAFGTFEALRDSNVKRNSATYAYMIQIVTEFFPASEMAGNIAHSLWLMAQEDQVIDAKIMQAMENVQSGNYEKYETFLNKDIRDKTIDDVHRRFRKFSKSLRCERDDDTY